MKKEFITKTKSNKPLFFYAGWLFTILFTFPLISGVSAEDWTTKSGHADSEALFLYNYR